MIETILILILAIHGVGVIAFVLGVKAILDRLDEQNNILSNKR